MTIERKLLGTTPVSGEVLPEAVSFDGTNDHLKRSTELTGNAVGKMFTFSAWFYFDGSTTGTVRIAQFGSFNITCGSDGTGFHIDGYPTSGNPAFYADWVAGVIAKNQWNHVLISIDVTGANTAKRHVYLNDVNFTTSAMGFDSWYDGSGWFNDVDINFLGSPHYIGGNNSHSIDIKGRLAHVYLDKTYRDLSTTSNRRLFIDAEGKPSSTIPSSPIVYLPMKKAATAGANSGTGGDYAVVGILATAERGPNQDNCVAMKFDGSNDYIRKNSSLTGTGQTARTMTFSAVLTSVLDADKRSGTMIMFRENSLGADQSPLLITQDLSGTFSLTVRDTTDNNVVSGFNTFRHTGQHGETHHVCFSIDLDNTSASKFMLDGVAYNNPFPQVVPSGGFRFNANRLYIGSDQFTNVKTNASMGEFYWDDAFIDLTAENPFWDSDTKKPIPLNKVIENTGTTPLIAMRMHPNSAQINLGTGGQFGLVGTPYAGTRGGSEFFARGAKFNGSSGKLLNTSLSGLSTGKKFTCVFRYQDFSYSDTAMQFFVGGGQGSGDGVYSQVTLGDGDVAYKAGDGGTDHVEFSIASNATNATVMISVDNGAGKVDVVIDGVYTNKASGIIVANGNVTDSTENNSSIGARPTSGYQYTNGIMHGMWMDDSYIDLSQEANRNKFVDELGYLKDLGDDGSKATGSAPLVYMKFFNSTGLTSGSMGTNSGTGGNYTSTPIAGITLGRDAEAQ